MATKSYFNDYARMPATGPGGTGAISEGIIKVLIASDPRRNPRNTVYLELETWGRSGKFEDPWGTQYMILLDDNLDGKVVYRGRNFTTACVAVSAGPDGTFGTPDDIASSR